MRSSSGISCLRLEDGKASKSRLRGHFDRALTLGSPWLQGEPDCHVAMRERTGARLGVVRRLSIRRIMASRMRAETVLASRSKSRVNCRLRLIQAKVPSTIYRFGKATKRWRWAAPDDLDRPASRGGDRRGRFRPLNPASAKRGKRRRACCNRVARDLECRRAERSRRAGDQSCRQRCGACGP